MKILQIFGSGTACVVTPVGRILYKNNSTDTYEELLIPTLQCKANVMQRCRDAISDIQVSKFLVFNSFLIYCLGFSY